MKALVAVLASLLLAPALADEREHRLYLRQQGTDTFVAGDSARIERPVQGDLVAAGGELRIDAPVAGDVVAVGGLLRLDGKVSQNLYAGGGQVTLEGALARNARVAGGNVTVGPRATISGNASLAGGRVEVLGNVDGYLQAAGGRVYLDGKVAGDVTAAAGELELGPNARIGGKLTYRGAAPLVQHPQAQVAGGIERLEMEIRSRPERERKTGPALFGVWTLGLMASAAVLVLALPGFFGRTSEAARRRFGWSVLWGFLALAAGPLAVVVLLVTVIGVPLALIALLAFFVLLLLGYLSAGIALGDGVLARWWSARAASRGWRALFAALGVLAIGMLALIPWLGGFIAFLALITGMGALLIQGRAPGSAATG